MDSPAPVIFVADDDPLLLRGLDRLLRGHGYAVRTAAGGTQLLGQLAQELPGLLLTDVMMPEVGGLEVLERMRGRAGWAGVPVLVMTASPDPGVVETARRLGAAAVLSKPFGGAELLARISDCLAAVAERAGVRGGAGPAVAREGAAG
jgi:CheY-like chemotaxis protein